AFSASPERGPEIRITAIAAGGRPEERAKMVSRGGDIATGLARVAIARNREIQPPIACHVESRDSHTTFFPILARPCRGKYFLSSSVRPARTYPRIATRSTTG